MGKMGQKLIVVAILALAAPGVVAAQSSPVIRPSERDLPAMTSRQLSEADLLLKPFFGSLSAGQYRKAFETLMADVSGSSPPVWLPQIIGAAEVLFGTYGGMTRYELAESRCYTPDICRNTYVLHTAFLPVYFILGLYRREVGTWVPSHLNLTDQASQIF